MGASNKFTGKIYVVGDSTVCHFNDNYYLPRYGYGTQLHNYINVEKENVVNLALSGRSSLSFLKEPNYAKLTNSITKGDYLIIGFGHNDEKSDSPERFTLPTKSYLDNSDEGGKSFQNTLYDNYVKMAIDKGATPILCTPIVRYSNICDYSGQRAHIISYGNYAQAIRNLGESTGTTVIDLTAMTKADYTAIGTEAEKYLAHTTYKEIDGVKIADGRDDTHINMFGAKMVCYEFATALKETDCSLKNYIRDNIVKPDKDTDFIAAINEDYVKPVYKAFSPATAQKNKIATIGGTDWFKSVMGEVGDANNLATYKISEKDGIVTIGNDGNNGKISDTADGFGAVFVQIDANKNFTASATVTVTKVGPGATYQSAFGLMLRDDIYIDSYISILTSNFVVAGAFAKSNTAIFSRSCATLITKNSDNLTCVAEGAKYNVSLERVGQVVTVTFNDGINAYTKTYTDFDFQAVDNDYMYLCLFVSRGLTAEFSDISFKITGNSQGA